MGHGYLSHRPAKQRGIPLAVHPLQKGSLDQPVCDMTAIKGFGEGQKMPHELCVTYDGNQGADKLKGVDKWPHLASFLTGVDMAFDWVTESLDRKFVSAMERCINEDPDKKREMKLLKRTVLVLMCVALGILAVCIKFSVEPQVVRALLG